MKWRIFRYALGKIDGNYRSGDVAATMSCGRERERGLGRGVG